MKFPDWWRVVLRWRPVSAADAVARSAPFTWPTVEDAKALSIACLVCQGVLVDELRMFEHVISDRTAVRGINVGATTGRIVGVAGSARVDETFASHDGRASIVFVPGAIGALQALEDPTLMDWLQTMVRRADWVIAASTGSLLVAATGALAGRTASTHWLAKDVLHDLGADAAEGRLAVHGNVVTCSGQAMIAAAVDVALGSAATEKLAPTQTRPNDHAWRRPASSDVE